MSKSSLRAVSMMIGTWPSARIRRQVSNPSMPGSIRSSTTRSGARSRSCATPSSPVAAVCTVCPCLRSASSMPSRTDASSSTTNTTATGAIIRNARGFARAGRIL